MTNRKRYGTAWNLRLVRGDLVKIVSEYKKGCLFVDVKETLLAIVLKGPGTEKDVTKVLYIPDKNTIFSRFSYIGEPKEISSGFQNFRRFMPAEKVLPNIRSLIKGLRELDKGLQELLA